jgi:high frequency lysogenization protein
VQSEKSASDIKYYPITIALAGMFQAAALARYLARTGKLDDPAFEASIKSLFVTDPKNIVEVYGNLSNLRIGLEELLKVFEPTDSPPDTEIRYYLMSLIHFEGCLKKKIKISDTLNNRIHQSVSQVNYFSPTHPQVLSNLADIYSNTIGTFRYHIKVVGAAAYVGNQETMNKVRSLLLAGVRSAVLWRQMGGSRLQLFFSRKAIVAMTKTLLKNPDYVP